MLQGPNKGYKKKFFFHIQRRSALRTECYKLMFTNFTTLTCVSALSGKLRPVSRSSLSSSNATNHCILSGDILYLSMTSFSRIFAIEVLTMYCLGCLVCTRRAPTPAILFQMKHPKNVFGRWRVPVKFTGKSDVIFSGPKLSCALRNTPKSFRELYGTVFVPEKFSGLLRNARQTFQSSSVQCCTLKRFCALKGGNDTHQSSTTINISFSTQYVLRKAATL